MNSTGTFYLNYLTRCMPFLFLFQMVIKWSNLKKKTNEKSSLSCKRAHKTRPDLVILHSDCQTSPRTLLKCSRLLRRRVLTWIYAQNPILFFLKENSRRTGSPEETKSNRCKPLLCKPSFPTPSCKVANLGPSKRQKYGFQTQKGNKLVM